MGLLCRCCEPAAGRGTGALTSADAPDADWVCSDRRWWLFSDESWLRGYRGSVTFRVLGPLEVVGPRGPVSAGGPVPRRILTALVASAPGVVPVGALVEAAWGEQPPASAERTLASHVARLRDTVRDAGSTATLDRRDGGYALLADAGEIDAQRFEGVVARAGSQPPAETIGLLREALGWWRPPGPFADLLDTVYPQAEAARLSECRGAAVEALVGACLAAGDPGGAATEAECYLPGLPYRERLWELLVVALYRQDRQAEALDAYRRAATQLREGLGVDPGPALREVHARVLAQDPRLLAAATPRPVAPCPYKGLARYEAGDVELYVGREGLVDELVARLVDTPLVVVVGPSGAGKSSLVRAGLIPALTGGALPGSSSWRATVMVPGADPVQALLAALADGPDLLVVDQAEEWFDADEARFRDAGDALVRAVNGGTRVVLAVRADLYGQLARHPGLARLAGPAGVLVGPPDDQELRRIVTEPAGGVGLRVEPALVDLIVGELRDRPGVLPVLSTALVRTWEHRDGNVLSVAAYYAGGGVQAALERVGEEAWAVMDDAQRAACRRILTRLVADQDGTWVARWVPRTDLVRDDPAAAAAAAVLTDHRLVVARSLDLGVAHEALLTGWPRLRGWLEDTRTHAALLQHLAAASTQWEHSGRDPGELYRGARLQGALDTAQANPHDVAPAERAFLDASAAEAERQLAAARARGDREARGRRRARALAGGLALALAFAVSAGGYALAQQRQAQATALTADATRLGALARAGGDYDTALLLAVQAVTLQRTPRTESDLLQTLLRGDAVVRTLRAPGRVSAVTYTANGSILAQTINATLNRWTPTGGWAPTTTRLPTGGKALAFTPAGHLLLDAFTPLKSSTWVNEIDPATGDVLARSPAAGESGDGLADWALAGDGHTLVLAPPWRADDTREPRVLLWQVGTPATQLRQVTIGGDPVHIVPCGATVVCVLTAVNNSQHQVLVRVDTSTATTRGEYAVPDNTVDSLAATPDGRSLALVGRDGIVRVIDSTTGAVQRSFGAPAGDPRVLAFSPGGHQLLAADGATIYLWDIGSGDIPQRFDAHNGRVVTAAWSPDATRFATGSEDGTVIEWDPTGRGDVGAVLTRDLSGDLGTLWATPDAMIAGAYGSVEFIDPATGLATTVPLSSPNAGTATARTGRDGGALVVAQDDGTTTVWDPRTRRLLGRIDVPPVDSAHGADTWVSPDGTRAATLRTQAGPLIIDLATRRVIRRLPPLPRLTGTDQDSHVQGWTADGNAIVVSTMQRPEGSHLLLVDATTGAVRLTIPTGDNSIIEAAADPTGHYLAIGGADGTLRVVDAHDGHPLTAPLHAATGAANNVSISPDARYIAVAGYPPGLTVWDTRTYQQVAGSFPLDIGAYAARARFTSDGHLAVLTGHTLRVFDVNPDHWLQRACREAGRTLTPAEWQQLLPTRPYAPACTPTR